MIQIKNYLQLVRSYRFLWLVILVRVIAIVVVGVVLPSETRQLNNINLWIKPLKFLVSAIPYLLTVPGMLALLPFTFKKKQHFATMIALTMLVENICIAGQAYRGQFSHFNNSSLLNGVIFGLMGVFILINTYYVFQLFIAFLKVKHHPQPSLIISFRYALLLFLFASVGGGLMIGGNHHSIGAADDAVGMFFTNWNRTGGDLRVMHFFGLHALQSLPLLAIAGGNRNRLLTVHLPALLLIVFTAFVFAQALSGKPFLA